MPVHSPRLVMSDHAVKNLLRRQAFVLVDRDGRVADGDPRANVCLPVCDADRELHGVQAANHGHVEAVMSAADEEMAFHCRFPFVARCRSIVAQKRSAGQEKRG
jgi:hypothetical protein